MICFLTPQFFHREIKHQTSAIMKILLAKACNSQNMSEYEFPLTLVFPCKDRLVNYVLIRENTHHRMPVFWQILRVKI